MKRTICKTIPLVVTLSLVLAIVPLTAMADPNGFAGGVGSPGDPYQISTWFHLDGARDHLDAHFILLNDLHSNTNGYDELASSGAHGGEGWEPIGTWDAPFVGCFDGQSYHVTDIVIDRPAMNYVGLFGVLGTGGLIGAVGMQAGSVTGRNTVGSLVGWNEGTVHHCDASGSVYGEVEVGGLVGYNFSTIRDCFANGSVAGDTSVGGLAGSNSGAVASSYATGNVVGEDRVGGLVGWNGGTAGNCYATGSAMGTFYVGGLLGRNEGAANSSYATGYVDGASHVGGMAGGGSAGTATNCFWDTETSSAASSYGGTGRTTPQMQSIDTFRDAGSAGLTWPWDILPVTSGTALPYVTWNIADGEAYPFLTFRRVEVDVKAGWNMVSVPGGLSECENTVAEVFGNQIVAIYYWNPVAKSYNVPTVLEPDQGYWVAVTEDKTLIMRI